MPRGRSCFRTGVSVLLLLSVVAAAGAVWICNVTITTPTPTQPPGPYGTITIESKPKGAIISVNGEDQGYAPVTLTDLWPGTYTITARMKGFETYTTVTSVTGATLSSVFCHLVPLNATNRIAVSSSPGDAQVYLDGAYQGTTPLTVTDPGYGTHIVQLKLSGYGDWKSAIEIRDPGIVEVSATLTPDIAGVTGALNVSSVPAGATVSVDGRSRGLSPIVLKELGPGIHIIQLDLDGYDEWKTTVDLAAGNTSDLAVTLVPQTAGTAGFIAVSAQPGGALVVIDGRPAGRIPANASLRAGPFMPGTHEVIVELPGYRNYSAATDVAGGEISGVYAVLVPDGSGTSAVPVVMTATVTGAGNGTSSAAGMPAGTTNPLYTPLLPAGALAALAIAGLIAVRQSR